MTTKTLSFNDDKLLDALLTDLFDFVGEPISCTKTGNCNKCICKGCPADNVYKTNIFFDEENGVYTLEKIISGLDVSKLELTVKDRQLTFSYDDEKKEEESRKVRVLERTFKIPRNFKETFVIPADADPQKVEVVSKQDGILKIQIGVKEESKARKIEI